MKKLPFVVAILCAVAALSGCVYLGARCQDLEARFKEGEEERLRLSKENSGLEEELESSAGDLAESQADLEEKESYIEGQKAYISELSEEVRSLSEDAVDGEGDEEDEGIYAYGDDPYPDLYAGGGEEEEEGEKRVYLTFDDGPSDLTPKVLDLLDQYGAKATFFVVAKNNEDCAQYLSEIVERGHTLALHSYSHDYGLIYQSVDSFLSDYEKVFDWVVEETGYAPSLFRFPGGSNNGSSDVGHAIIAEMERRGFAYFDWNVSSGDGSELTTTSNIIDNICSNVGNVDTPIVLMHDGKGKEATLDALPSVLEYLDSHGYTFCALDASVEPAHFR